jgi:branched-chain amino acid transport system substrate-binding protein
VSDATSPPPPTGPPGSLPTSLPRRRFLRLAGLSGAALTVPGALAGCDSRRSAKSTRAVKLGYVTPQTGSLAGFGEADNFVVGAAQRTFKDGIKIGGTSYPVEILVKDSQSDPDRAQTVAGDLIGRDRVDLMLVASTPETTNPVASVCEARGVPCISTVAPWQPWFFGRKGDPAKPFKWTWHFFWGLEDIIGVFQDMWGQVPNNQVTAALWPKDGDGDAWSDPKKGFPAVLVPRGYHFVDARFEDQADDFAAQVAKFRAAGADIVTGVPQPPDFATFWKQAAEAGFRPKIATVGKALLFPAFIEAMGPSAEGLSSEVWWSPTHPFRSSLTGATAKQLADDYTERTRRQWTQPIGFVHALFEVAADALERAGKLGDRQALAAAIRATDLRTIVGRISWAKGPVPNVAKTPLVGGQWRRGSSYPFELVIVSNSGAPGIPTAGRLQPIA